MAATPDGRGYWLVASDGGIFAFGDAGFYGSMGGHPLNRPIVGMTSMPERYRLPDGGLRRRDLRLRDAPGSSGRPGTSRSSQPIVGMAGTSDGKGYWMAAADGGDLQLRRRRVLRFGDRLMATTHGASRSATTERS